MPAERTFRVKVMLEQDRPMGEDLPHLETPALAFALRARTFDAAEAEARRRLEANGKIVRSVAHSPGDVLAVSVRLPKNTPPAPRARGR